MIAQVIAVVTMLTRYCLRIFICENLSFALKSKITFLFPIEDICFFSDGEIISFTLMCLLQWRHGIDMQLADTVSLPLQYGHNISLLSNEPFDLTFIGRVYNV